MYYRALLTAVASTALLTAATAGAATITVPATANPWLSGVPAGTHDSTNADVAPAESSVQDTLVTVCGGAAIQLTATGTTNNSASAPLVGPDGQPGANNIVDHTYGATNGIADVTAPISSLIGVFLTSASPIGGTAPAALNFSTAASQNQLVLTPALAQPFLIGDGMTTAGVAQTFDAPAGATRLFLADMDGDSWSNNQGSLTVSAVSAVPEPASLGLIGVGAAGLLGRRRRAARA